MGSLEEMATWARMQFKPGKARSLCLLKGRLSEDTFSIQGSEIPAIEEQGIHCLGKNYDSTLKDSGNINENGIIPRLQWPFLLYNYPLTKVEAMERMCSRFIRKWLSVPPAFNSVNLYSKSSKLRLQFSSVVEDFKVTKARAARTAAV